MTTLQTVTRNKRHKNEKTHIIYKITHHVMHYKEVDVIRFVQLYSFSCVAMDDIVDSY